jgi:hypothetical protein
VKSRFSRISRNPHWLIASFLIPFQAFTNGFPLALRDYSCWKRRQEPQELVVEKAARMTCKIERLAGKGNMVVLRLCGWIQVEHVKTIKELIEQENGKVALDLIEMTLVDRDVVNFLASWELKGIELRNCPAFLREWVANEQLRLSAKHPSAASGTINDVEDF